MGFTEASTIQRSLIEWAEEAGWEYISGAHLPRDESLADVVIDAWARESLLELNPELVGDPDSTEIAIAEVLRAVLDAQDGLIAANEQLTVMLRGHHAFKTADGKHEPRRFIDFEHPENNRFVVADEVTIKGGPNTRRFDLVFYVNGFPLVVVETKTPVSSKVSWLNAAKDLYGTYEVEYPHFFAPNLFVVATEGLTLRMAAVRSEPDPESELWAPWGSTKDSAKLSGPARVERAARLLLTPATVLAILHDFAMYRHARDASEIDIKLLPRYPQYEAAMAIHAKVLAGGAGGLIWHHQGSGKTELMAFASACLLGDPKVGNPTIIVIADRKDLVRQTAELFNTTGMPRVETPDSKAQLHRMLRRDDSGVIITTVHKFAEAGHLNDRSNIIVLVDEAHRSQEGSFGKAWREAVPNARFFGATGTAIEDKSRSTFKLFGDPDDPGFVMSRYTPEQSIADGFTKPVIVEPRPVEFNLDKNELDDAFDELADTEDLDQEAKEFLAGKASHAETILANPDRIAAVCRDIVSHYLTYVEPLGQKAQVVAYNQKLVVAYARAIGNELTRRGSTRTVGVVMHVPQDKSTPKAYQQYALTDEQEEALKRRFKNVNDALSFIVVTAKWMTGFNAPIEGVLYLDKPLKAANLFQTITRPNRPWKSPITGQRKEYGWVVDYIGLAKAIGAALLGPRPADDGDGESEINVVDIGQLVGKFTTELMTLDALFAGVDKNDTNLGSLAEAHERIPDGSPAREQFIQGFVALQAIWEFLDPNPMLAGAKGTYVWLAKVYQSVLPRDHSKTFLWDKYGAKTQALIHASMSNIQVQPKPGRNVTLDAGGLALVKRIAEQLRLANLPTQSDKGPGEVYQGVLDSIEARLKRRIQDADAAVYKSLADRIEKLRTQAITNVEESLAFLEEALQIARDVVAADRAAEAGDLDLYDPKTGALTQIVEENTPPGLHKIIPDIVQKIDSIVVEVAFVGWHEDTDGDKKVRRELRSTLKNYGLPVTGALFDKTYAYVRENY
jgi:type I restriction enzyme R subunit